MSLKLYFDLLSQPSRVLYIFLKTCKIPFEEKYVDLKNREQYSEEYEKINPFKKVPVIEHNGFILTESIGILRYLCREFNVPDHWYPKTSKEQAKVDEFLEWHHLNTRLFCSSYFMAKVLTPMIEKKPPNPRHVANAEQNMIKNLDLIENIWLKNKPYLTGNKISIADIVGACEVEQPRMGGYNPREGRPKLTAWLERVTKELSPHYQDAHTLLGKIEKVRLNSLL